MMQDIDFDELDRAVNSVINPSDAPEPKPQTTSSEAAPERSRETPAHDLVPERTSIASEHHHSTPRPAVRPSPAARRSSGRFMDVVHPSSDMRATTPTKSAAPKAPLTLTPPTTETTQPAHQPDPLDVMTDTPSSDVPLETPFLPDAKVEKRPLGEFSEAQPTPPPLDLTDVLNEDAEPQTEVPAPAEPEETSEHPDIEALLPESLELSEEALIGEPQSSDTDPAKAPADVEPATAPVTPPAEDPAAYDPPASTPLMTTSITQQYKEHAPGQEQTSGAIYDTEAYHQPLMHPHKKKSSWVVILWILGLITLGGGLGAIIYIYVLQML